VTRAAWPCPVLSGRAAPATPHSNWSTRMTPERLFNLAAGFAQATGNAERHNAYAASATDDERAELRLWDDEPDTAAAERAL
jgi:hypothetical protein